jgi:hypothetical protein
VCDSVKSKEEVTVCVADVVKDVDAARDNVGVNDNVFVVERFCDVVTVDENVGVTKLLLEFEISGERVHVKLMEHVHVCENDLR